LHRNQRDRNSLGRRNDRKQQKGVFTKKFYDRGISELLFPLFRRQVSRSQTDDMSVIHMEKLQTSVFFLRFSHFPQSRR